MTYKLQGLIAATFTPMRHDGNVDFQQIGPLVDHLIEAGVGGIFACGSTGESSSLTYKERKKVAKAFVKATGKRVPVVIQVGDNSLAQARKLAAHAQAIGADAIAATPPSYFRPQSLEVLIKCLQEIVADAQETPFYYYHIPRMTGTDIDVLELLGQADETLPTLAGVKYAKSTVHEFQECIAWEDGRFDMLFGADEMLLSGLCVGATGAVGSTYNFAAPLYLRVIEAFNQGDLEEAKMWQQRTAQMVRLLLNYRGQPAFKAMMGLVGVPCGPNRLPLESLMPSEIQSLQRDLAAIHFFDWLEEARD